MIRGTLTYLTPLDRDNAERSRKWFSERGVARYFIDELVPQSPGKMQEIYDDLHKSKKEYALEIHVAADDRYIGMIGFSDVEHPRHRQGEFWIGIGPEDAREKGYGTDASLACLRWGFETLGLNSTWLGAIDDNARGLALYRKLGFQEVGRMREHLFVDGSFHDMVIMDLTAADFWALHGGPE